MLCRGELLAASNFHLTRAYIAVAVRCIDVANISSSSRKFESMGVRLTVNANDWRIKQLFHRTANLSGAQVTFVDSRLLTNNITNLATT